MFLWRLETLKTDGANCQILSCNFTIFPVYGTNIVLLMTLTNTRITRHISKSHNIYLWPNRPEWRMSFTITGNTLLILASQIYSYKQMVSSYKMNSSLENTKINKMVVRVGTYMHLLESKKIDHLFNTSRSFTLTLCRWFNI